MRMDCAKIIGITPEKFTRNGMNDVPPEYILRPTARCAYCTGTFRCAWVMAMTPPITSTIKTISITPVPAR